MSMPKPSFVSRLPFRSWVRKFFELDRPSKRRRRDSVYSRLCLEGLENRLVPATDVTQVGTVLTFTVNDASEALTFVSAGATYAVTASASGFTDSALNFSAVGNNGVVTNDAGITDIVILDANTGVTINFSNSAGLAYDQAFSVTLDNATGNLAFNGQSIFNQDFTSSVSAATIVAGAVDVRVFANLSLTSGTTTTFAAGSFTSVSGSLTSTSAGDTSIAATATIQTGSSSSLTSFTSTGGDILINGNLDVRSNVGAVLNLTGTNITETATGLIRTVSGTSNIAATGNIDLSAAGAAQNNFGDGSFAPVNLSTSGASSTISIRNDSLLTIGDVTVGPNGTGIGALTIISTGDIIQQSGFEDTDGIHTAGAVTINVDSNAFSVQIDQAPNFITGAITIGEINGGDLIDLALRNVNPGAVLPTLVGATYTGDDIDNLTLTFDNNGIQVPTLAITDNLNITAGGSITQAGALAVDNDAFFTIQSEGRSGNFGIDLDDFTNDILGSVSFFNPNADATAACAVSFTNTGTVFLGSSQLGHGAFSIISNTGNIIQTTGTITQRPGAGTVTFTIAATGTDIDLNNFGNQFSGPVSFVGSTITTIDFGNEDLLATFPTLPTGFIDDLTIRFGNAPVVLPALTLTDATNGFLSATGQGVFQTGPIQVANVAFFNAINFPLILDNAGNDFGQAGAPGDGIFFMNSGPNQVFIRDTNALNFAGGDSGIGYGAFTAIAGGAITADPSIGVFQQNTTSLTADAVTLTSGGNIILDQGNRFLGELRLDPGAFGNVSIANISDIVLGAPIAGAGAGVTSIPGTLTLNTAGNDIIQRPGTVLNVTGTTSLNTLLGDVVLNNVGNNFGGTVTLTNVDIARLRDTDDIDFAASTVGSLFVIASGSIMQSGLMTGSGGGTDLDLDAGAAITFTTAGNDFETVTLASNVGNINIDDDNLGVLLGRIQLDTGALTITAAGFIGQTDKITQTGTGLVTLDAGGDGDVFIDNQGNVIRGSIALNVDPGDVAIFNREDITLSVVPTSAFGSLDLVSCGVVTLPAATTLTVNSLEISAQSTVISPTTTSIVATGGFAIVQFDGDVTTGGALSIDNTSGVFGTIEFFGGAVNVGGALTLAAIDDVFIGSDSVFNQGTNALNVNSGTSVFIFENAVFRMTSGTITMNGGGDFNMQNDAMFQVGSAAGQEIVTITGGGDLFFSANAALIVGLGGGTGTNTDKLVVTGGGSIVLDSFSGSRLLGNNGLAPTAPANVLEVTGGGVIDGVFSNTINADTGLPVDFLMGTDIALATYSATVLSVVQSGTVDGSGTFSVFQDDGDKVTVTTASGNSLAHAIAPDGDLIVVLRTAGAATATLTITTTKGAGDGVAEIEGIAVNGFAAATINAANADIDGDIYVQARLTALSIRDMSDGRIDAGGTGQQTTSITGRSFNSVDIDILSVLSALNVKNYEGGEIFAERFGAINVPGLATAGLPGNFEVDLVSRNIQQSNTALTSVNVAGELSGDWDLQGSVGTVKARSTDDLEIGQRGGAGVRNAFDLGEGITSISSLNLGFVQNTNVFAAGRVSTVTAKDWDEGDIIAGSIGSITTTGDATVGNTGDLDTVKIVISGNSGSATGFLALGTLNVKGRILDSTIRAQNGNIGSILAGREVTDFTFFAETGANSGKINTIKAADLFSGLIEAKSVGSINVVANLPAELFGDMENVSILLHGLAGNTTNTLNSFTAARDVAGNSFEIENGSVGSITAKRSFEAMIVSIGTTIGSFTGGGVLTSLTAGEIKNSFVLARSIGAFKAIGAAATLPDNQLVVGNVGHTIIDTYLNSGTGKAIGTFFVAGDMFMNNNGDVIRANNGIGSFTVKRGIEGNNTFISVNNSGAATSTVGRIGSISVGAWYNVNLMANSIGTVNSTGFTLTDETTTNLIAGDMGDSDWTVRGGFQSSTSPLTGIGTITMTGNGYNFRVFAPQGIKSITLTGSVATEFSSRSGALDGGSSIITQNPLTPTSGKLGSISAKHIDDVTIRANTIGSIITTKGPVFLQEDGYHEQNGIITDAAIVATATTGTAITTISAAGWLVDSDIRTQANIGTIKTAEVLVDVVIGAGLDIGTAGTLGRINSLSAAIFFNSALSARSVGTVSVLGNTKVDLVSNIHGSLFTIAGTGTPTNVALTTLTATGTVDDSTFNIAGGNVTSFTVGQFIGSDLMVGFHMPKAVDILTATTAANWIGDFRISTFKTTQPFSTTNVTATAAFVDSNVVASHLGTITITGVNPLANELFPVAYGVAFRDAATGGSAGTVVVADSTTGVSQARTPGYSDGKFNRNQLSGT